jgi:adenine-specific DNA methylase
MQNDSNNIEASSYKVQHEQFSAEKRAVKQAQQSQTKTSTGIFNQEQIHHKSQVSFNASMITQSSQYSTSSHSTNGHWESDSMQSFDDLEQLCSSSNPLDVEQAILKYSQHVNSCVRQLSVNKAPNVLDKLNEIIRRAWAVRKYSFP